MGRWSAGPWVLLAALLAGCPAHHAAGPPPEEIRLKPMVVEAGGPEALKLADQNAEELFQTGVAAFAAKDYETAARAFSRLVAVFPESAHVAEARYDAGLSWERMGEYLRALEHYSVLLGAEDGRAWRDAAFRAAECLYHLEDYRRGAALLHEIAETPGLDPETRIEALVKEGVCLLEAGDDEAAEGRLRKAVGRYHIEVSRGVEPVDDFFAAQGQFYLGELFRLRFERARFEPASSDLATLRDDLEHKAKLLLSAQGHYLRAIRMGHPQWATASGFRIGRLYEVLYDQLSAARAPRELTDPAERLAYREMVHERVRVLLGKAMDAYERTLAAAERVGVGGAWRARVRASFERVRSLLLEDVAPPAADLHE